MNWNAYALRIGAGGLVACFSATALMAQSSSGTGVTALPPVSVEAATPKKAAQKAAPKQAAAPAPVTPQPRPETATGPVKGYAASRSATGTKTDTALSETPQSVSVVGAEQIRDQAGTDIQSTLRYVPGVYADSYGTDSRGDYPRMRGGDPDIYLDGLRLSDAWRFGESRLDPYMLERIEVLKGPSSMLYGQTSVAGLINAVSKRPQEETSREIGVEVGSHNLRRVHTDMTGKLTQDGRWLYRFIAIGQEAGSQTSYVDNDRILIAPSLTYKPSSATTLTLMARYQKDDSGSMTSFLPHDGTIYPGYNGQRISRDLFVSEPGFDQYKTETKSIGGSFEHKLSDVVTLRQNLRYWHTDNIYHSMYPDWSSLSADKRTVSRLIYMNDVVRDNLASDSTAEIKFKTGDAAHKMLLGVDYRRIAQSSKSGGDLDTTPFDLYNPVYNGITVPALTDDADQVQTQKGVYLQDQIKLGRWIGLLGVRHDWASNDVTGSGSESVEKTTYRAGIMYELPFRVTPYFSFAQSFNPQYQAGCVPACQPYSGEQFEVGIKWRPTSWLAVNTAVYQVTEQNRLAYGNGVIPKAIGEARTRGAEIEVVGAVTSTLDIVGGYSYTDAIETKGDNAGKHLATVPLHQASLWARHKFAVLGVEGFSVGAGVRYVGESWGGADDIKTPGVTLLDAMVGWENESYRFQIKGSNLEDKLYFATCLDRGDCFWGTGRTVTSSLTVKF
ncbi:MAG: TonB-dependent siderophore receptor [Hyphomicrobiaceae bacterium]|nr:TonB-dependent siderophore receptor [Hyphomicrobiaceae bacterium]